MSRRHPECGRSIKVGDIVIFREELIPISEEVEILKDVEQPNAPTVLKKGRKNKIPQEKVKTFKLRTEKALKVYTWKNEIQMCAIGFVSKTFISVYTIQALNGRVAEITSVLSPYECEQKRSEELNGLARATILG